jgi:hypothetical protein
MRARAKVIRPTKEERDLRLRGECLTMSQALTPTTNGRGSVADVIRGAQMIFDWINGGDAPGALTVVSADRDD